MYNKNKILALITARGGSKGIKNKNIIDLAGKPLIAWTIESARASKYIDVVIVSTDSTKIKKTSEEYGATCPSLRPKELALDHSSTLDVIKYEISRKTDYEYLILLQPTSPLRTTEHIDNAIKHYFENSNPTDSLISVVKAPKKVAWLMKKTDQLKVKSCLDHNLKNRQNLPDLFFPNGAIYIAPITILNSKNNPWENPMFFEMDERSSVDIDTPEDLKQAYHLLISFR